MHRRRCQFGLEARTARIARVDARGARRLLRHHGDRADRNGDLQALDLADETREVEAQLAIEQIALEADFVAGQRFGVERDDLCRVERARVGAAALEAGRHAGIDQQFGREAIIDRGAEIGAVALVACDRSRQRSAVGTRIADAVGSADRIEEAVDRAIGIEPEVVILLAFIGIAHAGIDMQVGHDFERAVDERRLALGWGKIGLDELQREHADGAHSRDRCGDVADVLVRIVARALLEVIAAHHEAQRIADLNVQP